MAKKNNKFDIVANNANIPSLSNNTGLAQVVTGQSRVVSERTTKLSENVNLVQAITVDKKKFKKEYKPDIKVMHQSGVPTPQIAKTFDMSESYANKLLKESDKK